MVILTNSSLDLLHTQLIGFQRSNQDKLNSENEGTHRRNVLCSKCTSALHFKDGPVSSHKP